jgi:hypothetical protein
MTNAPHHNPDPRPWRAVSEVQVAPPRLRTVPVNRNGLPESRGYVYRGTGVSETTSGTTAVPEAGDMCCTECRAVPAARGTVHIPHKTDCSVGARVRRLLAGSRTGSTP